MSRFTNSREFLSGEADHSQRLTDSDFPITASADHEKGAFRVTEAGQMHYSNGEDWVPLAPPGTEMMIPPWVDVPEGWFEISGKMEGDFANRRVIANLFDFGYVEESLVTWLLPIQANLFETSAGAIQVGLPPAPVGLALDASVPRIDWMQAVSGSRPVWRQVTRTFNAVPTTFNQITFNRVGQQFSINMPVRVRGTMIVCTDKGIIAQAVDIPAGPYSFGRWERFAVEEVLIFDKYLTQSEIQAFKGFLTVERGRIRDVFSTVTSMREQFRDRTDLVSINLQNTQNVSDWFQAFQGAVKITDVQADTSSATNTSSMFNSTPALTFGPNIDTSNVTDASTMFRNSGVQGLPAYDLRNATSIRGILNGSSLETLNPSIQWPNVTNWDGVFDGNPDLDNRKTPGNETGWSLPDIDFSNAVSMNGTHQNNREIKNYRAINTINLESCNLCWAGTYKLNNRANSPTTGGEPYSFPLIPFSTVKSCYAAFQQMLEATHWPPLDYSGLEQVTVQSFRGFHRAHNGSAKLANYPANAFDNSNCVQFDEAFRGCALTEQSVNNILISIALMADTRGLNNGLLGMSGGTSAAPTGAGLTAKNALIARGWTVNTN